MNNNELQHFGIKGMKWGIRRSNKLSKEEKRAKYKKQIEDEYGDYAKKLIKRNPDIILKQIDVKRGTVLNSDRISNTSKLYLSAYPNATLSKGNLEVMSFWDGQKNAYAKIFNKNPNIRTVDEFISAWESVEGKIKTPDNIKKYESGLDMGVIRETKKQREMSDAIAKQQFINDNFDNTKVVNALKDFKSGKISKAQHDKISKDEDEKVEKAWKNMLLSESIKGKSFPEIVELVNEGHLSPEVMNVYFNSLTQSETPELQHFGVKGMKWGQRRAAKKKAKEQWLDEAANPKKLSYKIYGNKVLMDKSNKRTRRYAYDIVKYSRKLSKVKQFSMKKVKEMTEKDLRKRGLGIKQISKVTNRDIRSARRKDIATIAALFAYEVGVGIYSVEKAYPGFTKEFTKDVLGKAAQAHFDDRKARAEGTGKYAPKPTGIAAKSGPDGKGYIDAEFRVK